jgi:quinol monooxygenase YgiN
MISLFVKVPLKEGKRAEFIEAFKEIAAGVATEKGNLLYSLNFVKDAPNTAIIMERYTDQGALTAHSQSDHYKAFSSKIAALTAGAPEISIMEEVWAA